MATFGIIFTAYQCADLLPESIAPWIEARRTRLGGHDWVICAVSVPFEGFDVGDPDNTRTQLDILAHEGHIDHVIVSDRPLKETEARGRALTWLRDEAKIDVSWIVDSDELYTQDNVEKIAAFVGLDSFVSCYRLSLRNAVFDRNTFLVEPFTPMRIHRMRIRGYEASHFYDDNNVMYRGLITRDFRRDVDFANMTVPPETAFVTHLSWLNDERSRKKCLYQAARWNPPNGNGCSFRWDEEKGLVWNEAYFRRTGERVPEVVRE